MSSLASWDSLQDATSTVVTTSFQWFAKTDVLSLLHGASTSKLGTEGIAAKAGLVKTGGFSQEKKVELPNTFFQTPFSQGNSTSIFLSRLNHCFSMHNSEGSSTSSAMTLHSSHLSAAPVFKSDCKPKPASPQRNGFEDVAEISEQSSIEATAKLCKIVVTVSDFNCKCKTRGPQSSSVPRM